jgi:hypothetical protein
VNIGDTGTASDGGIAVFRNVSRVDGNEALIKASLIVFSGPLNSRGSVDAYNERAGTE